MNSTINAWRVGPSGSVYDINYVGVHYSYGKSGNYLHQILIKYWWLRSPETNYIYGIHAWYVLSSGAVNYGVAGFGGGVYDRSYG